MRELLELLTTAGKTFCITELGCGMPIAHGFMGLSGSSKVLKYANCPYSKEVQEIMIPNILHRSVSVERVGFLLNALENYDASFDIVYSLQAGDDKECHGFIGIKCANESGPVAYHFTLGYGMSKVEAGARMISLFIGIVKRHVLAIDFRLGQIDGAFVLNGKNWDFYPELLPTNHRSFVITNGGEWMRTTEFLRGATHLGIIKGSFNPYHEGHEQLVEEAFRQQFVPVLSLTGETVEGKKASATELVGRAKTTQRNCIIDSDNTRFMDLIMVLRNIYRYEGQIGIFAGIDVYHRMEEALFTLSHVQFYIYHREMCVDNVLFLTSQFPTTSSTKIRANAVD